MTPVARNEAELMKKTLETMGWDDIKVNSLAPFAREYHQRARDCLERAIGHAK